MTGPLTIYKTMRQRMKLQYSRISGSYFSTYLPASTSAVTTTLEFPRNAYFNPIQPNAEFNYDSEDMELDKEIGYTTDKEPVLSEREAIDLVHAVSTQSFEEELSSEEDLDEWLKAEMEKHMKILRTVKNVMVKIDKFELPCDFVVTDMPENIREMIILGRRFLETIHAQTDVFQEEISLGVGKERIKFDVNGNPRQSNITIEKIYMENTSQEEESFNPLKIGHDLFSYESPACLQFDQDTRNYDTIDPQNEISRQTNPLLDKRGLTKRWHICKPVQVLYDDGSGKDCGMWPTCDPDSSFYSSYKEVFRKCEQGMLRQWVCFRDHERRTLKGSFEELWRSGDENFDYEPPFVDVKTFEVKKYSFKRRQSFICITKQDDDDLPLGQAFPLLEIFPTVSVSLPLPRRYGLGLILYKAPCAIKGVLRSLVSLLQSTTRRTRESSSRKKASARRKGRTVAITTEDMQKRRNDVKARTTLLLALPDEHQLRFNKYDNAKELWEAILKTFSGNEATKKTKKNQLKQQYGNFKAEGSETLEQTFNRLQAIMSHLEFMDVPMEKDDLLTGLPEFVDDTVTDYTRPTPSVDVSKDVRSDLDGNNTSIFEQGETYDSNMSRPMIKFVKESGCPNAIKINNIKNTRKPTVKYVEMYRDTSKSPKVRGNQRNWNNLKSQQLGKDFLMQNKAYYKCGYFDHLASKLWRSWVDKGMNLGQWVNYSPKHVNPPSTHKRLDTRAVLLNSGSIPFSGSNFNVVSVTFKKYQYIDTQDKLKAVGSNVPTAKPTSAADLGNKGKAVKASTR
ncbi:ribonuclease H-like domain-containing protein [Tanacetum coccineum]